MQTWVEFHGPVDHGREGNIKKGNLTPPQQGRKRRTSLQNHVLYISWPSVMSFLISLVASYVFDVLESSLHWFLPWSQRLSFILSFLFGNLRREALIEAPREKKASGQDRWESHFHAGSALDSCQRCHFLWPITKEDRIYNLLTGQGGSVLRYSQINYFVGSGEERLPCLQAVNIIHVRAVLKSSVENN